MTGNQKKFIGIEAIVKKIKEQSEVLLIEGMAGVGADVLTRQLLALLIKEGKKVFVTTAVKRKKQIFEEFMNFGISTEQIQESVFLITALNEGGINVKVIDLRKLFVISNAVKSCFSQCTAGSLEILNTLFFLEKSDVMQKFVLELIKDAKQHNISLIIPIDIGIWTHEAVSFIENISDMIIELHEAVTGFKIIRGLRLKKMIADPPTPFFEYTITKQGIVVGDVIE